MSLMIENPASYYSIDDYSNTVSSWCEGFNNNSVLSKKLAMNSIGSGVMIDGVGNINGYRSTSIPNTEEFDTHNVLMSDWKVFFRDTCNIRFYNNYRLDLDPEGSSGVSSNGIRYLYLSSDGTYIIQRVEDSTIDYSKVYLMRYELYDNKIVSMLILPDLAGTDTLHRTQLANQEIQVYNCVVTGVAGTTSLSVSNCSMLIEGGNIYGKGDPNLVNVPASDKADIYYCDEYDLFGQSGRSSKTLQVITNKYRKYNEEGIPTIEDLPNDKYSIQQLSISPDGSLVAQYGSMYDSMDDAISSITTESFNFINLNKSDIYSPVCRVAYKSGAINSADSSAFRVVMIQLEGQVTQGGSSGGVLQGQILELDGRMDSVEQRNNIVVTSSTSVSGLRNNDMIFEIVGDY